MANLKSNILAAIALVTMTSPARADLNPYNMAMTNRCDGAGGRWQNGQCVVNGNGGSIQP